MSDVQGPEIVGPFDPADPVAEAEYAAYNALCICDDVYGENAFCPACYPPGAARVPATGEEGPR